MLIILIPICIGLAAIILMRVASSLQDCDSNAKFRSWCYRHDEGLCTITVACSGIAFVALLGLLLSHVEYAPFPSERSTVKMTLEESRTGEGTSSLERAAVLHKVIDVNRKIARAKYWNDSMWVGWFIPDRVAKLEYLK